MLANSTPSPDQAPSKKPPRSTLISRNITISGHRTSVRLEPEMWSGLTEICRREGSSLHEVCSAVAIRKSENTSLTAAIRVFVMAYYRAAATEEGHAKVGHGYGVASLNAGAASTVHARPAPSNMQGSMPSSAGAYANRMPFNRGGIR